MLHVQQTVFLILNSVPVTFVSDLELIRPPSIAVRAHSLDQKVLARKVEARKCTTEIVGNIQVERLYRRVFFFLSSHQPGTIPRGSPNVCGKS